MAVTFPDKQKWVASLEAAIKSLQRVDATFKRTVSYHQFLSLEVTSIHGFDLEIDMIICHGIFYPSEIARIPCPRAQGRQAAGTELYSDCLKPRKSGLCY